MFPPFPQEKALEICKNLTLGLEDGSYRLRQITEVSTERAGNGLMVGAMVALDKEGREVRLATVSGIARMIEKVEETTPLSQDGNPLSSSVEPLTSSQDENPLSSPVEPLTSSSVEPLTSSSVEPLTSSSGLPRGSLDSPAPLLFIPPIVSPAQIAQALEENDDEIHLLTRQIESLAMERSEESRKKKKNLEKRRTELCSQSLEKIFALYDFACFDGKRRSLMEICGDRLGEGHLPPNGTGECCAPKLLDYAFSHDLIPVSMAEVYWGKNTDTKKSGQVYPPCDERCGIILPHMLGLEILYRDESIVVVNKQSGVLSVPGRGPEKADSIANRLRRLFPQCIEQPSVHRLDMETSGILVLALTKEAHRTLSMEFERGGIEKNYVALLEGNLLEKKIPIQGQNELYFRVDLDNRPHQMWDEVYGKKAITQWNIIRVENYTSSSGKKIRATRVLFTPHTGRTHQLRLASADPHGFGVPIIGDTLYGHCEKSQRLLLHATHLTFTHPVTGNRMTFDSKEPF